MVYFVLAMSIFGGGHEEVMRRLVAAVLAMRG
jgi:hypothetical protein